MIKISSSDISIDIWAASSCHLGWKRPFDERAVYESHIYPVELGMLPSSTQIHNFTSFNWLIIYSMTVGAISLCNIFCEYKSCVFFSWTCRNILFFVDEIHLLFPETEPILLQRFYNVWKVSILGGRAAISNSTWAKLKWHYPIPIFSREHFLFFS